MSLLDTSKRCFDLLPSKRKLDDYVTDGTSRDVRQGASSEFQSSFKQSRIVNDSKIPDHNSLRFVPTMTELAMSNSATWKGKVVDSFSSSRFSFFVRGESSRYNSVGSNLTQFFVIMDGKSVAFCMDSRDTVLALHEELQSRTGIRVMDQRLIFQGKQLRWEQSLEDCLVQRDSNIHLVTRMRSTAIPLAFQVTEDIVSRIMIMCRSHYVPHDMIKDLRQKVDDFIAAVTSRNSEHDGFSDVIIGLGKAQEQHLNKFSEKVWVVDYLKVFLDYDAPKALVALYRSSMKASQKCADDCVRSLVSLVHSFSGGPVKAFFATVLLEFCRLLMPASEDYGDADQLYLHFMCTHEDYGDADQLYLHCRNTLGSVVKDVGLASGPDEVDKINYFMTVQDVLPFLGEVVSRLKKDMDLSVKSNGSQGPMYRDVSDFSVLLYPLRSLVEDQIVLGGPILSPIDKGKNSFRPCWDEILVLFWIFNDLCCAMDQCLEKIEKHAALKENSVKESFQVGWSQYLILLKELNKIGKLYKGADSLFWNIMRCRKAAVCDLIVKFATQDDDYGWLFPHKSMLHFESRSYLAMLMFPEVKEDYEELHEMLIDRSEMLPESFEYISSADPFSLHAGLFIEFKNEEATGPGVMREWFLLVSQAIFNPDRALFVACPLDRRRFFPNPASKVDQLHLEYFRFSGRVIALALMHKIQIGILLDRVFFLQLAETSLTLEDIKDADPYIYNSCKQILEMDPEFIDSDALGLTFVREFELLGSRKVVELRPGGKQIIVNSENRHLYVQLLIEHAFVKSISEQVTHFTQGFTDIISSASIRRSFFQCLELEDLDRLLHGSGFAIPVEEWKLHTEYCGYQNSDPQISWFWEVVGEMSEDQRRTLLFFWTSIKYLPIEGFRGLSSKLYIDKSFESSDHLPSSHTCFFRLSIPPYPSMEVMLDRLHVITKEHVSSSFGTW